MHFVNIHYILFCTYFYYKKNYGNIFLFKIAFTPLLIIIKIPEGVLGQGLLVPGVLSVRPGQVDEAAFAGIALVPVQVDVGPTYDNPATLPNLIKKCFLNVKFILISSLKNLTSFTVNS